MKVYVVTISDKTTDGRFRGFCPRKGREEGDQYLISGLLVNDNGRYVVIVEEMT